MEDFEELKWTGKDIKTSDLTNGEIYRIIFFNKFSPFLTFITRYYPFSLLWKDRRFHFKYKEIAEADDRILEIAKKNGFWFKFLYFERNSNLLIIFGKFIPVEKGVKEDKLIENFEKVFEKENVYISKPDTKTVKISFIKQA